MTFIVAIQLNDSIIVAADQKHLVINDIDTLDINARFKTKLHFWKRGLITGTGESHLIVIATKLFKRLAHSDINQLPLCLGLSKTIRELIQVISCNQIQNTKLLCSTYSDSGAQLYIADQPEPSQLHELIALKPMEITVWLFNPNIESIAVELQNLYTDLKDYRTFAQETDWINHYINHLSLIYEKQSQQDSFMSKDFDIFFQTKDKSIFRYVPNSPAKKML